MTTPVILKEDSSRVTVAEAAKTVVSGLTGALTVATVLVTNNMVHGTARTICIYVAVILGTLGLTPAAVFGATNAVRASSIVGKVQNMEGALNDVNARAEGAINMAEEAHAVLNDHASRLDQVSNSSAGFGGAGVEGYGAVDQLKARSSDDLYLDNSDDGSEESIYTE